MISRDELIAFSNDFLRLSDVPDPYCYNGLQVPGKKEIKKIALGVSASRNFLQQAKEWGADAVMVHHGLFWGKGVQFLDSGITKRIKILLENDISLFGYHLPLDAHREVGNNAQIAKKLGLKNVEMVDISAVGEVSKEMDFFDLAQKCGDIFGMSPVYAENFGEKQVKKIGICSGGGADYAKTLLAEGIDTFLTGEISEQHFHEFAEMPMNFLACGHHATERFGIQAFGNVLKKQFPSLNISFFPERCPV